MRSGVLITKIQNVTIKSTNRPNEPDDDQTLLVYHMPDGCHIKWQGGGGWVKLGSHSVFTGFTEEGVLDERDKRVQPLLPQCSNFIARRAKEAKEARPEFNTLVTNFFGKDYLTALDNLGAIITPSTSDPSRIEYNNLRTLLEELTPTAKLDPAIKYQDLAVQEIATAVKALYIHLLTANNSKAITANNFKAIKNAKILFVISATLAGMCAGAKYGAAVGVFGGGPGSVVAGVVVGGVMGFVGGYAAAYPGLRFIASKVPHMDAGLRNSERLANRASDLAGQPRPK